MKRILCAAALAIGQTCLNAAAWETYYRTPATVYEIDVESVRGEGFLVYYTYRQRMPGLAIGGEEGHSVEAVAHCAVRQRGDVAADGSYTLRDVYAGTGQELEMLRACALADGAPPAPTLRTRKNPAARTALSPLGLPLFKVAFIYVGAAGAGGAWTSAHDLGREQLEAELAGRIEVTRVEGVPEGRTAQPVLQALVDQGNELIFATSFGYMRPVLRAAQENRLTYFEYSGSGPSADNVRAYEARMEEGAYLAGIAAGSMTQGGILGVVAPVPIPEVVRNINAFTLGARSVRPDAITKVAWVGSWFDPPLEAKAAVSLVAGGADVLLQNTDSGAVLETAQRLGKRAVGWYGDMRAFGPQAHVGSVVVNWGVYYTRTVRNVLDGTWAGGRQSLGIREGAVGLISIAPDVPVAAREQLAAVLAQFRSGAISPWQGPLVTNLGSEIVPPGAILGDRDREYMNFYVQGVEGILPGPGSR